MRVLVCDDERGTRLVLKRVLSRDLGWYVTECENGQQALDVLNTTPIDLLLLDVQMPILDGVGTVKAIRESSTYGQLPVVMLSQERDLDTILRLRALGIDDYIVKPPSATTIVAKLRRFDQSTGDAASS
jgi:DNA-binding response OmpR family regulator